MFTDLSKSTAGKINKWEWILIDGENPINIQNPEKNYTDAGVYSISLTVWDEKGNTNTLIKKDYIHTHPKPEPNFSFEDTFGCTPLSVPFHDLSKPGAGTIDNLIFDFGDGEISINQKNPVHVYNKSGIFFPALTVYNSFGCKAGIKIPQIKVLESPKAQFRVKGDTANCEPYLDVLFQNETTGDRPFTFRWDFGDGTDPLITNGDQDETIKHVYNTEGNFSVRLIATNTACGKSDTIVKESLIQLGKLIASFETDVDTFCTGTQVIFNNTSTPVPEEAVWDMGNGQTKKGNKVKYTYSNAGTYNVKLNVALKTCKDHCRIENHYT